jgi:opacity protein-like surface antigen
MPSPRNLRPLLPLFALPALAVGQQVPPDTTSDWPQWPLVVTVNAVQVRPSGEFARNVGLAYGGEGSVAVGVDRRGILRLRLDGAVVGYGSEKSRVPLSPTIGGRINVDLVTTNMLFHVGIGPELGVPTGPVRPYIHAGVGYLHFTTDSHIEGVGLGDEDPNFRTNNFHDGTSAKRWGGGVRFMIAAHRGVPITIDLGATRFDGGHARYLKPGRIIDHPDGSLEITPYESDITFTAVRLGVTFGR